MQLIVRELAKTEYPLWDYLVCVSAQRSLFAQRWWMDIVTFGEVQLLGCFAQDRLLAGLPIWPCQTFGVRRLRQPPITPYWGPLLAPLAGDDITRTASELRILTAFAEALAPWQDIAMQFHPSLTNWLGFARNHFRQMTRYTYRIDDWSRTSLEEATSHGSIRSGIRRARKNGLISKDMVDPQIIAHMAGLTMGRQGLQSSSILQNFWPTLFKAALEHQCLFTTAVVDGPETICCAVASVWDDRCAYSIFGGTDPTYHKSGAWPLCIARGLEFARSVAPAYDFEGSMLEPVEPFFRRFGGTLTPYFLVTRANSWPLNTLRFLAEQYSSIKSDWQLRRAQGKSATANTVSAQSDMSEE